MPDQGVAAQDLAALLGLVGGDVGVAVSEDALGGLGVVPLHAILRDDLAELGGVAEKGGVGAIGLERTLAEGRTEVLETSADGEVVEHGRHGGGREKRSQESLGVHGGGLGRADGGELAVVMPGCRRGATSLCGGFGMPCSRLARTTPGLGSGDTSGLGNGE